LQLASETEPPALDQAGEVLDHQQAEPAPSAKRCRMKATA
jgi:hypothetical protein